MLSSSGFFPLKDRRALWQAIRPGHYHYQITPQALVCAFMTAFVLRLSGLREVVERTGRVLGTRNFSSLTPALRRPCSLRYVQGLIERLESRHRPQRDALVAIDGMAVTLPSTQRHRCAKYNRRTVGGGVIWTYAIEATRGLCPVRVLKVVAGAWRDCAHMKGVTLIAHGPVYLMDRGFYALGLIEQWLEERVRFIVRARKDASYDLLETLSRPRRYGAGRIELDARVRLGSATAKAHPVARLIRAVIGKQILVLVTSQLKWSAERVLDAYKKRERIEQFHRFLKEVVGLAHLYSFSQSGMTFLLYTALLVAMLLLLGEPKAAGEVIGVLRRVLRAVRRALGLGNVWKRNTFLVKRAKTSRKNH